MYYGWRIVFVSFLSILLTFPLKMYTFGIFMKDMSDEMGWSRASTSGVLALSMALSGLMWPLVGRFIDRRGPRTIMATGVIISGCSLLLLSRIDALWQFYVVFGVMYTIGEAMFSTVACNVTVSNWFIRKRATALGISTSAISFGGIILVPFVTYAVGTFGWRSAWTLNAALQILILLPSILIVMRRRPEDIGLLPDGATSPGSSTSLANGDVRLPVEQHVTLSQAIHRRNFWLLALSFGVISATTTTFSVHVIPFATDGGISPAVAAAAISILNLLSLPGRFFYGWLADRVSKRALLLSFYVLLLICYLVMSQARSELVLYVAVFLYAMGIGGQIPVNHALIGELYGRRSLGVIAGSLNGMAMIFQASLPVLAAYMYDTTGNYSLSFLFLAVATVIAMLSLYFVQTARRAAAARSRLPAEA